MTACNTWNQKYRMLQSKPFRPFSLSTIHCLTSLQFLRVKVGLSHCLEKFVKEIFAGPCPKLSSKTESRKPDVGCEQNLFFAEAIVTKYLAMMDTSVEATRSGFCFVLCNMPWIW